MNKVLLTNDCFFSLHQEYSQLIWNQVTFAALALCSDFASADDSGFNTQQPYFQEER